MSEFFLGIDGGGTKTHALISDENGNAVGFASAGTGNYEAIGYDGLTEVITDVSRRACSSAGINIGQVNGIGLGLAGYDWPSQKQDHLAAIEKAGLKNPLRLVNDAVLGIPAGSKEGWGISVVSGTGCNSRGLSRDHLREGRVVGGASHWSGEAAGGYDILLRALRAVTFEWDKRGPATSLSRAFLDITGAKDLDELIEGMYIGRFGFDQAQIMMVFEIARQGDPQACEVMHWAGMELGGMAVGVAKQLDLCSEEFDVVLIGSIFDGHPAIRESLAETIHQVTPGACLVRLTVPPVVGAVLLGMEAGAVDFLSKRNNLIVTTKKLLNLFE